MFWTNSLLLKPWPSDLYWATVCVCGGGVKVYYRYILEKISSRKRMLQLATCVCKHQWFEYILKYCSNREPLTNCNVVGGVKSWHKNKQRKCWKLFNQELKCSMFYVTLQISSDSLNYQNHNPGEILMS